MQVNVGSAAFLTLQLSPDSPPLLPPSPVLGPCLMFSLSCITLSCFFAWFCVLGLILILLFFFWVGSNWFFFTVFLIIFFWFELSWFVLGLGLVWEFFVFGLD